VAQYTPFTGELNCEYCVLALNPWFLLLVKHLGLMYA